MSNNNLVRKAFYYIKNNPSYNYIAFATTPWQALGIEVVLKDLNAKGIDTKGFIFAVPHEITGRCIDESTFIQRKNGIILIDDISDIKNSFVKNPVLKQICYYFMSFRINSKGNPFYIIGADAVNWNMMYGIYRLTGNRNINYILVDDGVGAYTGFRNVYFSYIRKGYGYIPLKKKIGYDLKVSTGKIREKILENKNHIARNYLYKLKDNAFVRNEPVQKKYKDYFYDIGKQKESRYPYDRYVIINTQGYYQSGQYDGNCEIRILKQLSTILRCIHVDGVIKPHPRETDLSIYNSLGLNVDNDFRVSQEVLISRLKKLPICIISVTSSSLGNISTIFDIPCISLAKIFIKEGGSREMIMEMKTYISRYHNLIKIPEDYNALMGLIEMLN